MIDVTMIDWENQLVVGRNSGEGEVKLVRFNLSDVKLLMSTGINDIKGEEIFEGGIIEQDEELYCVVWMNDIGHFALRNLNEPNKFEAIVSTKWGGDLRLKGNIYGGR